MLKSFRFKKNRTNNWLISTLLVLPLLVNPVISTSFDTIYLTPKLWWLWLVIFPLTLLNISFNQDKPYSWREDWLLIVFGLSLLLPLTAHTQSDFLLGITGRADGLLMHLLYILLAWGGLSAAHTQSQASQWLTRPVLLLGTVAALSNVGQQLHWIGVLGQGAFTGTAATLMGGLLGNRGYLGGLLALLLPLACTALANQTTTTKLRPWLGLALILIAWAWLGSYTRGAWLAGGLALIWLFLARPTIIRWCWPWLLAGSLLFTAANAIFSNSSMAARDSENLSSGRTVLWHTALYGIEQKPLLGWGGNALARAMNNRPAPQLFAEHGIRNIVKYRQEIKKETDIPTFIVWHSQGKPEIVAVADTNKTHNEYLEYALTYGIPAALLFIALLITGILKSWHNHPEFSAALVAYAIYLFTWPDVVRFAPIAWFILGMALAQRRQAL